MFIRAVVAVGPAIAALLGTDALRLVLALPRTLPIAKRASFFVFAVDTVLEAIAYTAFKCSVALCLAMGRRRAL